MGARSQVEKGPQSTASAMNLNFKVHKVLCLPLRLRKMRTAQQRERTSVKHRPGPAFRTTLRKEIAFGDLRTKLFCEPAQPKRTGPKSVP